MIKSLKRSQASRAEKQLRSLERWEQIRAKGQARFIIQSALTFSLTMVGVTDVWEHVMGHTEHSITLWMFVCYLLAGLFGGFRGWNAMEGKYNKALVAARANTSSAASLQNNP